eukprot:XP_025985240.1 beta-fructofuranosidase, insoluble isoenzyme 1-like [Glycine max]
MLKQRPGQESLRYQREEAKIQAWVNLENAKAEDLVHTTNKNRNYEIHQLETGHLNMLMSVATHHVYRNLHSLSSDSSNQPYKTAYHFQPPKHWINGIYIIVLHS